MKMVRFLSLVASMWLALAASCASAAPSSVIVLAVSGAIGPATADFIVRGIARAETEGAALVVLELDTPGGLDTSMRAIIKAILSSRVPVATFIAPSGARAASAGTYIIYASHIAAMAPGTNLGAATPVQVGVPSPTSPIGTKDKENEKEKDKDKAKSTEEPQGDPMARKHVHDAAAYIRGLAQLRNRNADWAERAVREAVSLSADEALREKVIDVVARDVPHLLEKANGRKVSVAGAEKTVDTAGATVTIVEPDWKSRFLAVITDPSIALILMMLGIYGLFFEFSNPGMVLPGVVGGIALLLGLFALQMLPINYAGLALIILGMAFMIAEAFLPAYGSLGIGGIIAFAIGAIMLIDTDVPGFGIPLSLIVGLAVVTGLFVFFISGVALKARGRPVVTGHEELIGSIGEVVEAEGDERWARVHSEQWRVESAAPLVPGQRVRVTALHGLVLTVVPVEEGKQGV